MKMEESDQTSPEKKPNCLQRSSNTIVYTIGRCFYHLGRFIGKYPWAVMLVCVLLLVIFLPGVLFFFYEETAQENLWVPTNSVAQGDKSWVDSNFPSSFRFAEMVVVADDVLSPASLQAMMAIHKDIISFSQSGLYTWESICYRLGPDCWSSSLLELWSFNETVINSLTKQEILDMVNSATTSPVYNKDYFIEKVIGGITRDGSGDITAASAATISYFLQTNSSLAYEEDERALAWETEFITLGEKGHMAFKNLYYYTVRSFADEGGSRIQDDIVFLGAGYVLIIVFLATMLGHFNAVHQRIYVSLGGVVCVGLAIGVSYGLCSYAGLPYGPLHNILPFLLIGIGVDDMFVIVQSWENINEQTKGMDLDIPEKIARTLEHAGVAITVTSLTNILAFGVGATTVLPALQSFCIYCSIGILFTYIFQATFFVACITYDERRAFTSRNACCCCYVHKDWTATKCSQKQYGKIVFQEYYAPFLMKLPVKITLSILTLGVLGVCIWGVVNLEQEFDPNWFLPPDGSLSQYLQAKDTYYPDDGIFTVSVYLGELDYHANRSTFLSLHDAVNNDPYTDTSSVLDWYYSFAVWLNESSNPLVTAMTDADNVPLTESNFYSLLSMYMFSSPQDGIRFVQDIQFGNTSSYTDITASRLTLSHIPLENSRERVAAMDSLRASVASVGFEHKDCFAYSREYLLFESDKAIQNELYRNIGLAFLSVVLMTLLLIAHPGTCALVCLSVGMVLVEVGGMIHFWGLTIDTVTTINLVVAVGLAVDYSAHIGLCFMTVVGTRKDRTIRTLADIGPAVLNGGFSTFLAFILLAGSKSYVFSTFFKVFFMVVVFGLFQGLVFLPIVLSWLGPDPYLHSAHHQDESSASNTGKHPMKNGDIAMKPQQAEKVTSQVTSKVDHDSQEARSQLDLGRTNPAMEFQLKDDEHAQLTPVSDLYRTRFLIPRPHLK